jgi:hypothetical protein
MSASPSALTADQLCTVTGLTHPQLALLKPDASPRAFFDTLLDAGHHTQAVMYLAHAIPAREGIWWAWSVARKAVSPDSEEAAALKVVEEWIASPSDETRRACKKASSRLPQNGAVAALSDAVFFPGNLAEPGASVIPAPAFSSSKFVAACIILCAYLANPHQPLPQFQSCLNQGLDVVRRIALWPSK